MVLALAGLVACLVVGILLAPLSVALFAPCVVIVAIHAVVAARSIATCASAATLRALRTNPVSSVLTSVGLVRATMLWVSHSVCRS